MNSSTSKSIFDHLKDSWSETIVDGVLETVHAGDDIYILDAQRMGDKFGGYMIDWEKRRLKTKRSVDFRC